MADRGVFAVARSIWTDADFDPEPFTQREAFMWLVSEAAWKDHKQRGNGKLPIELKRGEFSISVRFMAEAWIWSKSRVARFLKTLEKRDILRDTSRDSQQVYSIKNYNKFQVVGLPKRDTDQDTLRDSSGTAAGQQRDKLEKGETLEEGEKVGTVRASGDEPPAPTEPPPPPEPKPPKNTATYLPADWTPSLNGEAYAVERIGDDRLPIEVEKFRDYWASASGEKARKRDWDATWRTWVRKAAEEQRSTGPPGKRDPYAELFEQADNYLKRTASQDDELRPDPLRIEAAPYAH